MPKKLPNPTNSELREQRELAYQLHELACSDRDECTYSEDYTTEPPSDDPYYCMTAVIAENAAASVWRVAALRSLRAR